MPQTFDPSAKIQPAVRPTGRPMGWAHVLFFGRIADRYGRSREVAIPQGGCPLSQVRVQLAADVDGGAQALAEPGLRIAVGHELCSEGAWVLPGQEVAFFSAFSGG